MSETLITIKINRDELEEKLKKHAIEQVINEYFGAYDVPYEKRESVKSKRIHEIVGKADWSTMPEALKSNLVMTFMEKIIKRMS